MFKKFVVYKTLIESGIFIFAVCCLVVSLIASLSLHGLSGKLPQHQLADLADAATNTFAANLDTHVFTLYGLRGYFAGSDNITRSEFQMFVSSLDLPRHSPGIWALLYLDKVEPTDLARYQENVKNDTSIPGLRLETFRVWPEGERPSHLVVSYSEPSHLDYIRDVLGYDFASNVDRLEAFNAAVKLNQAVMTNPVVSAVTQSDLFILLLPTYKHNQPVITHDQRKAAASGAVAMSFQQKVLFNEAFQTILYNNPTFRIRVYDGPTIASEKLLYDSYKDKQVLGDITTNVSSHEVRTIEVANRVWTLESSYTTNAATGQNWYILLLVVNILGLIGLISLIPLRIYVIKRRT